ncbi:E3 ubiquitin-protein ligase SspH2 [Salmonella enterica subsp. arizonae]|uniref:E3 ubiquitin-protein ligase SspH2 n=1 Tax=Salmonella enterica subsp. arizonae TaxID=59203 RepID=A0A379S3Y4_SALER|nr:E3 ubiquitin-protein ligase SspH2 [Salmonella enterica subsp. arizonae]
MPFHVGSGCRPAAISNRRIYRIALFDTPPEMSSWEKGKEFFLLNAPDCSAGVHPDDLSPAGRNDAGGCGQQI